MIVSCIGIGVKFNDHSFDISVTHNILYLYRLWENNVGFVDIFIKIPRSFLSNLQSLLAYSTRLMCLYSIVLDVQDGRKCMFMLQYMYMLVMLTTRTKCIQRKSFATFPAHAKSAMVCDFVISYASLTK